VEAKDGHWYEIRDDELNESIYLPSSTNILSCFPNPGLDFWRETTSPEEIRERQEAGKMQGSKMHHCIDLQISGETVGIGGITRDQIEKLGLVDRKLIAYLREPLTEREEEALIGMENFWNDFRPVTVSNELLVFSLKYKYAGTMDWIGYLWNKKKNKYELWIVDWKISKTLDRSYDLQLASYWRAFEETYKRRLGKIRLGILQLGKNKCKYSFKEVEDKNESFKLFLKTKEIWDDLHPSKSPKIVSRREKFSLLKFNKRGKKITL
jgi:hypothetical protein